MAAIASIPLARGPLWPALAGQARVWLAGRGLALRDVIVLLPFAALLAPAREAFAAAGGWMPRIETPLTLAATLAPPPPAAPGALAGDTALDRLNAAALLRRQPWGAARERDDARAFAHIVAALVDAAQALREAALRRPPPTRAAYWAGARAQLPPADGPGAFEALLLRVALEWAASAGAAPTDALFGLRPAAWVLVRIGGDDALAEALAAAGDAPALCIDADRQPVATADPERWLCDSLDEEAQAAAALVIDALNAGRVPVALVALDRMLVRRVRALLDRRSVPLVDETGWALSTSRAAARPMSLLRAAAPGAGPDARLDWLKNWPGSAATPAALDSLEAGWRGARRAGASEAAAALWVRAESHLRPLASGRRLALAGWLALLGERLAADGSLAALAGDAAGQQILRVLRLPAGDANWAQVAQHESLDLAGFTAWVDATLEAALFVPLPGAGAEVVLTPLARAIGRPFAQVVVPGADHRHLGVIERSPALIGEALAEALGLDSAASRRRRQRLAFAQLLRAPALVLLRRRRDGDEPLAASPEVEALALERAAARAPLAAERDWQPLRLAVEPAPQRRPAPVAANDLPGALSASAVEALRDCPYRFFARSVLRLSEPDELEAGLGKRDYGSWLHAVLHHFHAHGGDGAAALARAADAVTRQLQLDPAELLPWRASFEVFAPAYLAWWAVRAGCGWRWEGGEVERSVAPPALLPQRLGGRIDRLDRARDGSLQVIDYKTGSVAELKARVAAPLEDTQLAFYAALEPDARCAIYLALDDRASPLEIEHPDVGSSAAALVDGLSGEFARLRAGAALPALGEGRVCETCEMRGLCRRDHWGGE